MNPTPDRVALVVAHTGLPAALRSARLVVERLVEAGFSIRQLESEAEHLACTGVEKVPVAPEAAKDAEMVIVLGGDGTLLRAAELARPVGAPILGINLGRVGFLAEAEREDLSATVDRVVTKRYEVEERMTIDVIARVDGEVLATTWALNEASIEKSRRERMIELIVEIDGRPLSRWACDGLICATPTGSTAYAFSVGGPVVWPAVEALLLAPISAHSLFARPLVVSPRSVLATELVPETPGAVLTCDGRRQVELPSGARIEVRRGSMPVRLARLHRRPFTDRLVAKFGLPVTGWRGRPAREA